MKLKNKIEALLFATGEKFSLSELSKLLSVSEDEIKSGITELAESYNDHAVNLMIFDEHYQLATKPEYYEIISKLSDVKFPKLLTDPQLEVLSVIAYKQPISKVAIEKIRGIKSDKVIKNLIDRKLIEESGQGSQLGNPVLYTTTVDFLRVFGFESIKDLPQAGFVREEELKTIE